MKQLQMLGLKTKYNFKEVRIFLPRIQTLGMVHDTIFLKIIPLLAEQEKLGLINGFHFIMHDHLDLRLSSDDWTKIDKIEAGLKVAEITDTLVPWAGLDPEIYGGEEGVALCYNNLEYNSRLIMGIVQTNYTGDREPHKKKRAMMESRRDDFVYAQFPHFLRAQFGVGNALEARIDLGRFWSNVKIIQEVESKKAAVKLFVKCFRQVFFRRR